MVKITKTWWGQSFVAALEEFCDPGRLSRGKAYTSPKRMKTFDIHNGQAIATIRGNANPYFGVYKEPTYITSVELTQISPRDWSEIIQQMGSKASFITRLMLNEIPENIEDCFQSVGETLLPHSKNDCSWQCSCPDWGNPCKHVAGVFYKIAQELDQDPFLLFELRGIPREDLQAELARSPLGQVLIEELAEEEGAFPEAVESYYSIPDTQEIPEGLSYESFWQGQPNSDLRPKSRQSSVSALLIKKQGDYPAFWPKETSFITIMEEFYERFKEKNKNFLE